MATQEHQIKSRQAPSPALLPGVSQLPRLSHHVGYRLYRGPIFHGDPQTVCDPIHVTCYYKESRSGYPRQREKEREREITDRQRVKTQAFLLFELFRSSCFRILFLFFWSSPAAAAAAGRCQQTRRSPPCGGGRSRSRRGRDRPPGPVDGRSSWPQLD